MNQSGLSTVEAAFADAAQAERAIGQLRRHGIDGDRIDVQRGGTDRPGRTAAEDRELSDRMIGSWLRGGVIGILVGALLGALIAGLTVGSPRPMFWAIVGGMAAAFSVLGALWGVFMGFGGVSRRRRSADGQHRPEVPDAVRVRVAVNPEERDTVRRVLADNGGA